MNIVIRQATIVDPASPHHNQRTDLFIQNGILTAIGAVADASFDQEIQAENVFVSPGWVDPFAHFSTLR